MISSYIPIGHQTGIHPDDMKEATVCQWGLVGMAPSICGLKWAAVWFI
jgi:hypothetical protein